MNKVFKLLELEYLKTDGTSADNAMICTDISHPHMTRDFERA